MTHLEKQQANEISRLRKIISKTSTQWLSEKVAMELYGWSRTKAQKLRIEHPYGVAWICEGGNKVSANDKTVRSNVRWSKEYIDKEIFKIAA